MLPQHVETVVKVSDDCVFFSKAREHVLYGILNKPSLRYWKNKVYIKDVCLFPMNTKEDFLVFNYFLKKTGKKFVLYARTADVLITGERLSFYDKHLAAFCFTEITDIVIHANMESLRSDFV